MADHLDVLLDVSGKRVLDVGCGEGWLVRRLASQGADVVGLECGAAMLQRALTADPAHPHRYVEGVGQDMPFDADSFDVVVFSFSLHHVPANAMQLAISEAARVVRTGGTVHVIEPVAQGLGHEVDAIVDDETHVRALAQAAADQAAPNHFVEGPSQALTMGSPYQDFAEYEQILIGIDPDREQTVAQNRVLVEQKFATNAIEHDGRWWFEDHILVRTFTRLDPS